MEEAGIRPSQRARKVGDYRLDSVDDFLDELEKFEDEITTPEPRECLVSDLTLAKQDDVLSDGLVVAIKKLEDMPDELELREQELPSQEDWEEAINRAGIIFGITVSSPRNASNVSDLATKLKEAAGKAVEECQIVTDDLDGKCGEWRIDSASSARFQLPEEDRPAVTLGDEVVDLIRNHPAVEVKGATYTELSVTRDENGTWTAGCVVDV